MNKPYLLVVTGRPGAGKSTFAKALSEQICMPVVSRDSIKEGYVHTFGKSHSELPPDTNSIVTRIFFETVEGLLDSNVSLIVEAAFQHGFWSSKLEQLMNKSQIIILICTVDERLARDRYIQRGLSNGQREFFHGDKGVDMARKGIEPPIDSYNEPNLPVPTFRVDTSGEYSPSIAEISKAILRSQTSVNN